MRQQFVWRGILGGAFLALLSANAIGAETNLVCTRESDKQAIQLVVDETAGTAGFVSDKIWQAEFTASTVKWVASGSTPNADYRNTYELNRNNGFLSVNNSTFGGRVITPAYSSATYRCEVAKKLF